MSLEHNQLSLNPGKISIIICSRVVCFTFISHYMGTCGLEQDRWKKAQGQATGEKL